MPPCSAVQWPGVRSCVVLSHSLILFVPSSTEVTEDRCPSNRQRVGLTMMDNSMASAILDPEDTKLTSNNHAFPNSISPPPLRSVTNHKAVSATGTECVVCGDTAPKDTLFRRHYSVICCEACKCFFRRTVQMNRDYKCRYGNSCSVGRNPVNVKQVCQACRFNQCLKAGMKIECE